MCAYEYCSVLSSDHEHFCLVLELELVQPKKNLYSNPLRISSEQVPISLIPTYFLSSWCALLSVSLSKPCHRQDCGLYTNCNKTKHKHLNI